ncbi:hypothetical protein FBU59_006309 [Linderina macrospora]|uniref:Uncharacterized protein n=1 Tax=Linderina macrospora TaxID=4868 RepID=A0ACC1J0K6_9FUNG|nr:hypothetical protein FBU59_006309 [Linderina macrospora]
MAAHSSNNIAIVTGASRGIGKAISLHLLSKNVSVVGFARNASALNALSEEAAKLDTSAKFFPVAGDVVDESAQQKAVDIATENGTLVALVNNAAINEPFALIADATAEDFKRQFDINVIAPLGLIRKSLPQLRQSKGRVINVASAIFKSAVKNQAGYGGSKAAINYITETLALEEPEVTTLSVHPGVVDTDMSTIFFDNARRAQPELSAYIDHVLATRITADFSGRIVGNLALFADHELSGTYVEYDEPKLAKYSE